jgi:hypothetical protein
MAIHQIVPKVRLTYTSHTFTAAEANPAGWRRHAYTDDYDDKYSFFCCGTLTPRSSDNAQRKHRPNSKQYTHTIATSIKQIMITASLPATPAYGYISLHFERFESLYPAEIDRGQYR